MDILTVVSLSVNVLLIIVSVALTVANWKASRKSKSQVKIWLEQANGVNQALLRIVQDRWNNLYSSVGDMTNAVHAVQASALSLWTALYEERVLTEKEYKDRQKKIWKKLEEQFGLSQDSVSEESAPSKIVK